MLREDDGSSSRHHLVGRSSVVDVWCAGTENEGQVKEMGECSGTDFEWYSRTIWMRRYNQL